MKISSSCHRFRKSVALSVSSEQMYLTPEDAIKLGQALIDGAIDVVGVDFCKSGYHGVDIGGVRESGHGATEVSQADIEAVTVALAR